MSNVVCIFVVSGLLATCSAVFAETRAAADHPDLSAVDHLVYAAPDLDSAVARIERLLGVRATAGGSHPGMGTRNALISLGPATYLEIIAPDPAQADYRRPRVFRIDELDAPRLVTWAAKSDDIDRLATTKLDGGARLGAAMAGSRETPDGSRLAWQLTDPYQVIADGVVPFFIDWGDTPHPAGSASSRATLVELRAEHPDPERIRRMFAALGLDVAVTEAAEPALSAIIDSPRGRVELR